MDGKGINMNAFLILGNQLFEPQKNLKVLSDSKTLKNKTKPVIFMREDNELCTHFKYHKHKILFFLSAMRKYAEELKKEGFEVHYEKIDDKELKSDIKNKKYEDSLIDFIKSKKIQHLHVFEIEDKFFETRILKIAEKNKIKLSVHTSPMFFTTRERFKSYISPTKRPFMKTFYEAQRKYLKILIEDGDKPVGGQWSFDEENRKPLSKNYTEIKLPVYKLDAVDQQVANIIEKRFADHPGSTKNFWLPTDRKAAQLWFESFLKERFKDFGTYEDALSDQIDIINHSVLTPYLNTGLLTPDDIIKATLIYAKKNKISMGSTEGFIRQIIGWREFIRGIYQNYSEKQDTTNFWNHQKKLTPAWYTGDTGIKPLDDVIKKTVKLGYAHHIERLMVVGSLMLLLEIHPQEAHKWFMEMFIDSSDWVMGPNVYGMAIFSDGGVFATKPYFCGSNYYKKMGPYKTGDWQPGVDGLYWSFIENHKTFFLKNPRLSMMARTVEKMDEAKKKTIFSAAKELKKRLTI